MNPVLKSDSRLVSAESGYICQCVKMTESELLARARKSDCFDFDQLRAVYGVGSRCTSCEVEIRDVLHEAEHQRVAPTGRALRVPMLRRVRAAIRPLPARARFWARRALRVPRRYEIFVVRRKDFESELVLSNLKFPDDERNPNGDRVRFDLRLRDQGGSFLGEPRHLALGVNESRVITLAELYPHIEQEFTGTLAIHFYGLRETGSLRPYCRLRYEMAGDAKAGSCHYHDQFTTRKQYQHVIVTHPLVTDETCWVAFSNPVDAPYDSLAYLQLGEKRLSARVTIAPRGAFWKSIPTLFGLDEQLLREAPKGVFWLESDGPLMAWFFWHDTRNDAWSVQHK
jgi:bacterioferritin-associated ferredoxin